MIRAKLERAIGLIVKCQNKQEGGGMHRGRRMRTFR